MRRLALLAVALVGVSACGGDTDAAPAGAESPRGAAAQTRTVEVVPQACLDAITSAREGFGLAAEGFEISSEFPSMIVRAAQAGMAYDADAIDTLTGEMEVLNGRLDALQTNLSPEEFSSAAARCEAAAQ